MIEHKESLKYGQVLRIHNDTENGLLISKGFTDPNVYYMAYQHLERINNYRDSLFQILPRGTFEIHDEYLKEKDKSLFLRMKTEEQQYNIIIQSRMNEEVKFGAEVILRHLDSGQYLFGSYQCSEFSTDAFKLLLREQLSSQCVFRLSPYQTYQQNGQQIYIDEQIILTHEKSQCKVDYVECSIFLDREIDTDAIRIKKPTNPRVEAVISLNSISQWVFRLHIDHGAIKPYDLVFLHYSLNNSYLSVDQTVFLKQYKTDVPPLDSVWEIQPVGDAYVLRHSLTGQVLNSDCLLEEYSEKTTQHMYLKAAKFGIDEISYNTFIQITQSQRELQISKNQAKFAVIRKDSTLDLYFNQLNEDDLDYIKHELVFRKEKSLHGFKLKRLKEQDKRDMLLIQSSHELLQQFGDVLKLPIKQIETLVNDSILSQLCQVITHLILYVVDDTVIESENLPLFHRQTYLKDMHIVNIIMQIIYFISMKNDLNKIFKYKKSERSRLRQIFKLAYLLIEKMTKNNPQVKLFISQWLELFLHQAMTISDVQLQNSLSELLDDNYQAINKFITKETLQRLVKLVSQRVPHEKYLRIFSCIVVCNGKSIINNQINILKMFYESSQIITSDFKFQLKIENGRVLILSQVKWRTLNELYVDSADIAEKDRQQWNYFLQYLSLLSDICMNRNKFGKKYVEENFPLNVLCCLLEDPDAKETNAVEQILKLIHSAYIDCQHYTPIRRIARVREWTTIETKKDILKTHAAGPLKPENCDLKRVMTFIQNFLEDFQFFSIKERKQNQNLFTVLSVLKTTLRLGFWLSITQLQDLLPNLLKISSCNRDFTENEVDEILLQSTNFSTQFNLMYSQAKQRLTKLNSETIVIMKSKVLACEIIDIIIDMETNVRVSKSTKKLKKIFNTDNVFSLDLWSDKFARMINKRDVFVKCNQYILEVLFAELTLFENPDLLKYSLKLLSRIYGQRRELIFNFDKILIVADGFTFQLSVDSRVTRTKLLSLNDRNILQATLENQKDYNIYLWRESDDFKESGVIQDLYWLVACLKTREQVKRTDIQIELDKFPKQIYTERERNHKLHQSLIKCQDLHENIMYFIENAVDLNEFLLKFLRACYQFITMLVWNHQENKNDFITYLPIMMKHIPFNVGCIEYLRELFHNNRLLLFNENLTVQVCEHVIKRCNDLPFSDYYKSSLLDFLRVITYFSNKPIKINQLQIMALLQDRRFTNLMLFYSNKDCLLNQLESIMEQYHKDYQAGLKSGVISVAPTVTYVFNYFQLLSLLIEDQNEINMGKCKQMHPHHLLIQTYQLLGQCWPLKRYVRAYINRLYYTSQEYGGITQQIIELDIENIIGDLSDLIEFQQLGRDITLQEPTRYTYMQSYVYLTLEENLIMLNLILNRQQFLDDLEDTLQTNQATQRLKLHLEILEIGRLLSRVQRVFQTSHICQFTSILILVFRSIYKTFDLSLLIIRDSLYNSISIEKSPSSVQIDRVIRHKTYKNRRLLSEIITTTSSKIDPAEELNTRLIPYQDMLDSKEKMKEVKEQLIDQLFEESIEYKARPKGVFQQRDTNEKLNIVHKELMNLLQGTEFETFVEQEFYQVCEKLNRIDYEGMQLYGTSFKVIRLQDFIENIIQLNLKAPDSLDESLRIFFLKVLARIITEKNINNQANVEEWQPEDWQDCKTQIQASQNLLVDCKAAELICSLLKNQGLETRTQLTNELLIFGVTYLLGGNTRCQNSILDLIKQDSSNTILHNFSILIRKVSRMAYINYKIRKSKNKDSSTFKVALLDNYDSYDGSAMLRPKLDSEELQQVKRAYVILLNRSFRFLQLLCENNNVEMKNYIRQQADKDGTVRSTSINFIEFATSQLRIYFKIINKSLIQVPSFICDFLIEVIQVPCLENQLVICKTTFFEDACYLLQYLSQQERLKIRQLDGEAEQEQLQQLYNKILIAIMSVLEGNDDRIYEDLKNKLEPQFLLEIVHQNLRGLEVATAKDMIRLLDKQGLMYGPQIMNILNVLIIKANMTSRLGNSQWLEASETEAELQKILDILNQRILKIEIIYQDKPQVIYFPHHGLFDLLSSETRDKIMYSINRDTQRDKILGVLNQCRIIHNELEYNYDLSKYHIAITETSITTLSQIAAVFSIIVNILMVITLNVDIKNQVATLVADFSEQLFINMFEFCQLFSSLVYYAFYLKSRVPLCLKTRPSQEFKIYDLQDLEKVNRQGFGFINALTFIFKWENQLLKKKIIPAMKNIYHFVSYYFQIIVYISVHEDDFIRITLYVIFAMLGTFVKSYYFSLHLFDLFSRLTLLQNVFQAISYNAKQLLVVALLGVLFMFVFSFTTFDSYVDEIYSIGYDGDKCETLISCMITLVTSGVIGTSMQKWDFIKFCYDTLYFVFSALLFTNIVSGIMIDTFAELRDQRQKIEDDKRNKCFICGIERVQLEKQNINFETHINGTHHLWNYIYYMYCLNKKDTTEYSGLEYAISDMIDKENISWFPIQAET